MVGNGGRVETRVQESHNAGGWVGTLPVQTSESANFHYVARTAKREIKATKKKKPVGKLESKRALVQVSRRALRRFNGDASELDDSNGTLTRHIAKRPLHGLGRWTHVDLRDIH